MVDGLWPDYTFHLELVINPHQHKPWKPGPLVLEGILLLHHNLPKNTNQTQAKHKKQCDLTLAKKPTQQSFQLVLHAPHIYRDNCSNPSYEPETLFALTQKEYKEFRAELEADYLLGRFEVAESIECWGKADIVLESKGSRQPSFQFGIDVEPEEPPGLIAEISFENRHKNDRAEAKKYIEQSGFNIKAVLVVNIWPEVDSTISLYRTRLRTTPIAGNSQDIMDMEEVFNRKSFRQPSGQHVNGKTNLSLTLDDFVCGENCQEWRAIDLNITFADLAAVVDKCKFRKRRNRRRIRNSFKSDLSNEPESVSEEISSGD
ncbi:hypothetical protein HD806DRAFT_551370 [Xylariaceae sp. AK1471]|nr:hypothetical protein HD806DRAFT_551370 [Xylariaceae sp. AK1471]